VISAITIEGKRGTKYEVQFSLDSLTNQVFIELVQLMPDDHKRKLVSGLEARGGVGGRLIVAWFGSEA
jgi:hypothetical protein